MILKNKIITNKNKWNIYSKKKLLLLLLYYFTYCSYSIILP